MKKFNVFWEVSHRLVLEAEDEEQVKRMLKNDKLVGSEREILMEPEIDEIKEGEKTPEEII